MPERSTPSCLAQRHSRSQAITRSDPDKQSIHETIVITTMLALAGHANAVRDNDQRSQAMFREAGRKNVTALTNASLVDLRNARSALGRK